MVKIGQVWECKLYLKVWNKGDVVIFYHGDKIIISDLVGQDLWQVNSFISKPITIEDQLIREYFERVT